MKRNTLLFLGLFFSCVVLATDIIQVVPFNATANTTYSSKDRKGFVIEMRNGNLRPKAIEFDITLPDGMAVAYTSNKYRFSSLSERFPIDEEEEEDYYTASCNKIGDHYKFLIVPGLDTPDDVAIDGTEGKLLTVYYTTTENIQDGYYPIMVTDAKISYENSSKGYLPNSSSYVTIGNPSSSDFNLSTMTGYIPSFVIEKVNEDLADNEDLTIVDLSGATELGAELVIPDNVVSVVGTTGTLKREFTGTYWSTVCLPFALSATQVAALNEEGVEIEEFTGFDETAGTVTFEPVTTMEANTPYIVKSETTQSPFTNLANVQLSTAEMNNVVVGKMTFMGTFEKQTLNSSTNTVYYAYNASNGNFVRIGSNATVPPFRAYLKLDNSSGEARSFIVNHGDGEATGINTQLQGCSKTGVRYNLLGLPQAENSKIKGIYIQNGQKIVVK